MRTSADVAERVMSLARERSLTLATAESCTAGCLAMLLSDAPGAGDHFHGGFVVYTKQQKHAVLNVPAELIARHTAVSRQVAEAMARGTLGACTADLGIAVTGVAGPKPDEDGNPVGLMHVAVARRGDYSIHHRQFEFGPGDRSGLRSEVTLAALQLAIEVMQQTRVGSV